MDQQVRRIAARYGIDLSEQEIERIAREAEAQEKVLDALYRVDLAQIRPMLGIVHERAKREAKGGKRGSDRVRK